ncbi:hypothetical protein L1987_61936 [Smallanthus sonchifolius]|uniref:Uncharacterized protein n=1 Tax=Smallanthus sonchifolius TaxID=185202 RepID=A0ACB9C972_9ASTR|nr:hypothetical protein L1987_61936 [Smallanthus sonchifolius]
MGSLGTICLAYMSNTRYLDYIMSGPCFTINQSPAFGPAGRLLDKVSVSLTGLVLKGPPSSSPLAISEEA